MNNNNHYKPNEFAELLNVSVGTLQRWDNQGILKAYRTPTNRRYYTYEQIYKVTMGMRLFKIIGEDEQIAKGLQNRD